MWRLKQHIPKDPNGLEGRTIEIESIKIQIGKAIAEGGFSYVYLAKDINNVTKQYALKHVICNDQGFVDLVKKEISAMKLLKGHPNIVTLVASTITDKGRTKEGLLLMEFCGQTLVHFLENKKDKYLEENQVLLIFRDVCNAVFAMHCQSPPIAHRDLKAENVLLGDDGSWKICDFGSISTDHKRFETHQEMGVEEENIRKHTTPAYRAPEMWDLLRRETISEKADIWAMGCLLFRISYLKSAFDGNSKLQILNVNYRIPTFPTYSPAVNDLIRDMLQVSPDSRPDINQVWFRVNSQLPAELQNEMPDAIPSVSASMNLDMHHEDSPLASERGFTIHQKIQPTTLFNDHIKNTTQSVFKKSMESSITSQGTLKSVRSGAPLGTFWMIHHNKDSQVTDDKGPIFDDEPKISNPPQAPCANEITSENPFLNPNDSSFNDIEIYSFCNNSNQTNQLCNGRKTKCQSDMLNTFVSAFDVSNLAGKNDKFGREDLKEEIRRLKKQVNLIILEKSEISSKCEKLSAIVRSQEQEIKELKLSLARRPSPRKDDLNRNISSINLESGDQREKIEGSLPELQETKFENSSTLTTDSAPWKAFTDDGKPQIPFDRSHPKSVRSRRSNPSKLTSHNSSADNWGFEQSFRATSSFTSAPIANPQNLPNKTNSKIPETTSTSQPAGWAGF